MYASKIILATVLALTASAASLRHAPRQIGGIACNAARLQVVNALDDAETAIGDIEDADVQADAQAGLDKANDGVEAIAQSLVAGEAASADGRDDVEAGLEAVSAALADGDADDDAVDDAKKAVDAAAAAGADVLEEC